MNLSDPIKNHFRLLKTHERALKNLGLETVEDLLHHFPSRYENISDIKPVRDLVKGDSAVIFGNVTSLKTRKAFRKRTPIAEGFVEDATGRIKAIWFHQPYLAKMIPEGSAVKVAGKVTGSESSPYLANPEIEKLDVLPDMTEESLFDSEQRAHDEQTLYPVYPESRGITSKWFYHAVARLLSKDILEQIEDPIPSEILKRYNLPSLKTALVWIHTPKREEDSISARKRFAFDEVFLIQLGKQQSRREYHDKPSFKIPADKDHAAEFMGRFPFEATGAQKRAIDTILKDFEKTHAMSRLLEGDVGSGKTAVAATTAHAVVTTHPPAQDGGAQDFGNLQVAYMAPTEILAKQQFESFIELFAHLPIQVGLITSSGCKKFPSKVNPSEATTISRAQLLKWVANGEIPILVGTHSLIQKTVEFENLAYVIIDEQHRFGTGQRQKLMRKDEIAPHLLSMTATPIPRTLALTIYGDLDLTLLDEMPAGRKPVITESVAPEGRDGAYEKIHKELEAGRQAYVICPRIDEPDPKKALALNVKSVKEECARLKKEVFPEYSLDILHSKMTPKAKEDVMQSFLEKEVDILVATSVVEVGVNIPNATVIVIEGAERFGLAQLHQLRGRVLRSNHQAYCYVFADSKGTKTKERLKALETAKNGFELAEQDLKIRGSGELSGRRQSGLSDIAMEAMKNVKMVEAAREEATDLIKADPALKKYPALQTLVEKKTTNLHFE